MNGTDPNFSCKKLFKSKLKPNKKKNRLDSPVLNRTSYDIRMSSVDSDSKRHQFPKDF